MDGQVDLYLRCLDCEYDPKMCAWSHRYADSEDSPLGCVRKVSEEEAAQYYHLVYEKFPMMCHGEYSQDQMRAAYKEVIDFLYDHIYSKSVIKVIGNKLKDEEDVWIF